MRPVRDESGRWRNQHTVPNVYREMFFQVCRDYASLPDPRTLRMFEIRAFYEPLRRELYEHTKPKKR